MVTGVTSLKLKANAPVMDIGKQHHPWCILIIDDDKEVHSVTRLILSKVIYKHRPIALHSVYSAAEARSVLQNDKNIAVILLDVVMETDSAGLDLVKFIREDCHNLTSRIILRTGQPGQAPAERVILDYDINDYKAKTELTAQKLFTSVISALRTYDTIMSLDRTRIGLEKILNSSDALHNIYSLQQFASGVLMQLSGFLDCNPNGIICVKKQLNLPDVQMIIDDNLQVLAVAGDYQSVLDSPSQLETHYQNALALIHKAFAESRHQMDQEHVALYISAQNVEAVALLHESLTDVDEQDKQLISLFVSKISLALENAINYQYRVTAEVAATTDYLTQLDNRRQLFRLGFPLVQSALRKRSPLSLAMIDIDHFKSINDTFGHDAGDAVLVMVADFLRKHFCNNINVVARYGGEEFCVIVPDLIMSDTWALFEDCRRQIAEQHIVVDNKLISVTVSIGFTTELMDQLEKMIDAADALLYRAKREGRNRVVF